MSSPRIYICIDTFHPYVGGAEKQALAQSQSLRTRGYEVTIITYRYERTWLRHEVIEGIPVIRVAGLLLGHRERLARVVQKLFYLLAMVLMAWRLWHHRHSYDILHVYQLGLLVLPAALVCLLTGKPMIVAMRSAGSGKDKKAGDRVSLVAGPLDTSSLSLQVDGHTWVQSDLEALERFGKPIARFAYSLLSRVEAVVVVLSSRMRDQLTAYNFRRLNTQFISNGVDIARFRPADTFTDEQAQVVVCVSKLRYEKGIDVLLQAWRLVQERLPDPLRTRALLVIVGDGPLRPQLENMAKALGITDSIEFVGLQSDVLGQLKRAGLAVLPSRWEGMPNALLEAMACGLPCVATRVSGSEDVIMHGVNGLLVEPEDYEELADALLPLLIDPTLAQKYGHAARTTVVNSYSLDEIVDRYIELYQRMMESKPGKTRGRSNLPIAVLDLREDRG